MTIITPEEIAASTVEACARMIQSYSVVPGVTVTPRIFAATLAEHLIQNRTVIIREVVRDV